MSFGIDVYHAFRRIHRRPAQAIVSVVRDREERGADLIAASIAAALIPGWRASRVDPSNSLRAE